MSDRFYETEQPKKKLKLRPLVPALLNKGTGTKHALVYDKCNLFEALEYIAYGTKPIRYPDKVSFFMCCPTCNLRQAIEYLALTRIPTDANGEKFNHYDDRPYMSDAECEQLKKINDAIPQLEVLIDEKLVKPILTDAKNNQCIPTQPVSIEIDPSSETYFSLTCGNQKYTDAEFNFNELEKAFKDYSQPQTVYKLTIDTNGLYLQVNNGEKEKLCGFNRKKDGKCSERFNILQKAINNPGKVITSKQSCCKNGFCSLFNKFFAQAALFGIKDAFFKMTDSSIIFTGDTTKLVRIHD